MNLEIISFNGTSLNDSSFKAYFPKPSVMAGPEGDAGFVERSYFSPVFTYKRRKPRTLPIHIKMLGTVATNVDTLKALFNPYSTDEYKLLVKDLNDSDKQYYVYGTPISIPDVDGQEMVVNLWVADPVWKTETETSVSWSVTGTGDQESITVGGSFYSEPTFEITPTAAKSGGKAYRIFCPVYNPSTTITYTDYPLDIVNNALDTAALVASTTKSNTINQVGGIGTDLTPFPIDGAVGGGLPASGTGYCGTEQFSFTISGSTLTPTARGLNGTSAATHADDAIIYLSMMEADGGDIQVTVDGIQDNFWLQDINNATTQMWINVDLSPGYAMTNGVLIAAAGAITTITLENSTANIDAINALPSNGRLKIDNEMFSYTEKNVTTRQFTGVSREAFGTAAAEHTVGDYVRWIEHEIYIYHGVHDLPTFTVNDTYKPSIELNSTNTSWLYDSRFATTDSASRWIDLTGAWRQYWPYLWSTYETYTRQANGASSAYWYYESMSSSTPSTQSDTSNITFSVLGQYLTNGKSTNSEGAVYIPSGFTHVAATGKRWRQSASSTWFTTHMFRHATLSGSYIDTFDVTTPTVDATAQDWSQATVDLSGTFNYLVMIPYRSGGSTEEVRLEVDTITLTIQSSNIPVVSTTDSSEYYHINASLINTTTGDYIDIDHYCNLNTALIINTSAHTVADNNSGAYARGAIQLSNYRHDWLKMTPGANVLQWDETGASGLTIVVKRRERKL